MYGIHLPWQGTGMSVVAIFLVVGGKLCCKLSNICKSKTMATSFWLSSGGGERGGVEARTGTHNYYKAQFQNFINISFNA